MRTGALLALALLIVPLIACGGTNVLLGEVRSELDGHQVLVTDCYRTSVPSPERVQTPAGVEFRWTPCRDAVIVIRASTLVVNGRDYGALNAHDRILVDHGKVSITR